MRARKASGQSRTHDTLSPSLPQKPKSSPSRFPSPTPSPPSPKSRRRSSRTSAWAASIRKAASTGSPPSSWASSTSEPSPRSSSSRGRISPPSSSPTSSRSTSASASPIIACSRTAATSTPKWVEYFVTMCGTLALEGGPIFWVATHRVHHQNSDHEGDPHTPARRHLVGSRRLDPLRSRPAL